MMVHKEKFLTPEVEATEEIVGIFNNAMIVIDDPYSVNVKDVRDSHIFDVKSHKVGYALTLFLILFCCSIGKLCKWYVKRREYQR